MPFPVYWDKEVTEENYDCCVKLSRLPWGINEDLIVNFFNGFLLFKSDIHIQKDDFGRPNGFAICVLASSEEAQRAIKELDHKNITAPLTNFNGKATRQTQHTNSL